VVAVVVPFLLALVTRDVAVATVVGLAFAMAAATFCPLLVLGIWWRGLTSVGAACGLVVGGLASGVATTLAVAGGIDDRLLGGWPAAVVGYPAAFTVPLAFLVMVVVSILTASSKPPDVARIFATMHVPERLGMGVERLPHV
jgi:Na+(H+)/acetate symporter ActP